MSLKHFENFLPQHWNMKSFLQSWTKRVKNFVAYPQCAHFLTHRNPIPCLFSWDQKWSSWLQHCFLGGGGANPFRSFILKLDIATSIFLKLHLPVITAVSFWSGLILGTKSLASDSKTFPRLSLPGAALKFVLWRDRYKHHNRSVHLFTRTSAAPD